MTPPPKQPGEANHFRDLVVQTELYELEKLLEELASRQMEALAIYEPLPHQKAFHRSNAYIRLLHGGNRGGKTQGCITELVRCITHQDPHKKFPKKGTVYVVGKDYDHIGQTVWPKISQWGSFKMIRDPKTGLWRAFRPNQRWDKANEKEAKPAPPLLPERLIKQVSWEIKKDNIPKSILTTQGWLCQFYSGKSQPPQGFSVHAAYFDEEIENVQWFNEVVARGLVDNNGLFWWGATAQSGTEKYFELIQRAEDPNDKDVESFRASIESNPYYNKDQKAKFAGSLSPHEYAVRYLGEPAIKSAVVYPEFSTDFTMHGTKARPIPNDWTIYCAFDPGRQVGAGVFVAIPPPYEEPRVEVFAEIYLKKSTIPKFCRKVKEILDECCCGRMPEAWLIDHQMGRQTQMTTGITIEDHYSREFKNLEVRSRLNGYGFIWGSTDIPARESSLRKRMYHNSAGQIELKIQVAKCPNLCWELARQLYQTNKGLPTDKRVDRNNHAVQCLEYLCAYEGLRWVKPVRQAASDPLRSRMEWLAKFFKPKEEKRTMVSLGPKELSR